KGAFNPQGESPQKNPLYTARSIEDIASMTGNPPADIEAALARARGVLLDRRSQRPRPHLDDKILTAWNGLMIAACARAARVLDAQHGADSIAPLQSAERAASFVQRTLWRADSRTLLRRYREGSAAIEAYSADYACLVWGLL